MSISRTGLRALVEAAVWELTPEPLALISPAEETYQLGGRGPRGGSQMSRTIRGTLAAVWVLALAGGLLVGLGAARAPAGASPTTIGQTGFAANPGGAQCDGIFHYVSVAGTANLDGSPTGIEYSCQTGSPRGPLLVYMGGGGFCGSGDTCDCQPDASGACTNPNADISIGFFNKATSDDGRTWAQTYFGGTPSKTIGDGPSGRGAFAGPTSPFKQNWNIVYIAPSTGDGYLGDKVRQLTTSSGHTSTAHFVGYQNVQRDLAEIHALFTNPSKVAVWGGSSGGVGLTCSLGSFRTKWPNTRMWMMDNAGPALGTRGLMPGFPSVAKLWGAWQPGPDGSVIPETCPVIPDVGSRDWSLEWVAAYDAKTYPDVIKALADDYSDGVISHYACVFGATPDSQGSCASATASTLIDEFNDVIRGAANFKVFYHTGICHTERESNGNSPPVDGLPPSCDFDKMHQGGAHFNDWVNAWITDSPTWVNVVRALTTTTLASSANPSVVGQPVTFTAAVSSTSPGRPTGTVTFFDGATQIGAPQALPATGPDQASLTTSTLRARTHSITARYNGGPRFATSTSKPPLSQKVIGCDKDQTTYLLTATTDAAKIYGLFCVHRVNSVVQSGTYQQGSVSGNGTVLLGGVFIEARGTNLDLFGLSLGKFFSTFNETAPIHAKGTFSLS